METTIITENSLLEISEAFLLFFCLIPCVLYARQSQLSVGRRFWLGSAFIFVAAIRKELNYLPDLYLPADFMMLGQDYEWWEDLFLIVLGIIITYYIVRSWRYLWEILKSVSAIIYAIVITLVILQYMGEHHILFNKEFGVTVEETAEGIIYIIALLYLWRFKLKAFEGCYNTKIIQHKAYCINY